mmetsp:Transcript_541/g.362  ORF Transcript_541/g.362 Transcript_541/m.362 type:complete len:201 (-) Transcript_541:1635-2237(-)
MICFLKGKLFKIEDEKILLLVNQIGYEVLLPYIVKKELEAKSLGDEVSLYIYYHQTERQPKPILIGFNCEEEKDFFQELISVGDIGPLKAVKSMNVPVCEIASAIESKDIAYLKQLKGVGERTARKIVATLLGRMEKFIMPHLSEQKSSTVLKSFAEPVLDVLVNRLGHKVADANRMIEKALERSKSISTPEELFDEIYR